MTQSIDLSAQTVNITVTRDILGLVLGTWSDWQEINTVVVTETS